MNLMFWRKRDIERAKKARDEARQSRDAVDRLTKDLRARAAENKFAPMLSKAFRGDG